MPCCLTRFGLRHSSFLRHWVFRHSSFLIATLLTATAAYPTDAAEFAITDVSVGFANHYRVGHWTPVRVSMRAGDEPISGQLELVLPDGEGTQSIIVSGRVQLASGSASTVTVYAKFGRVDSSLEVRFVSDKVVAVSWSDRDELPHAVLGSQQLVLTFGSGMGAAEAIVNRPVKLHQETIQASITHAKTLPDRWIGYAGVSLVVIPGSDLGIANQLQADQLEALDRWVRMGGRLLLCVGANGATMLEGQGPLSRFAPGTFDRVTMQRQTSGLEDFAGTSQRLDAIIPEGELRFRLPLTLLRDVRGRIESYEGFGGKRTPTVIRASHGLGQVVFLGLDLDQPPLNQWTDGRKRLWGRLFDLTLGPVSRHEVDQRDDPLMQAGFEDLTGQLRGALDQFGGVTLVPFSWIAALVGLYVVLMGPVDYFVLRKFKHRYSWTWFTFPLLVLGACALAIVLTRFWKGNQLLVNQIDLVDIDTQSGWLRGTTWSHVFSPQSAKYDLELTPTPGTGPLGAPGGSLLSWQGLPGGSFGGMNTPRRDQSGQSYRLLCDLQSSWQTVTLAGLPIDIYSSRSLRGQYWGQVDLTGWGSLVADANNQLRGEVRNPLDVELRDCKLCFDRWVYELPPIAARGTRTVGFSSKAKTIDGWLTESRVSSDFKDVSQPWNRQSLDVHRIIRMMMFHEVAGGWDYTGLLHRFQPEVDFSDHLRQGRAVLVGRATSPASQILLRNKNAMIESSCNHFAFYRLLLPVSTKARGASENASNR